MTGMNLANAFKYSDQAELAWFAETVIETIEQLGNSGSPRMSYLGKLMVPPLLEILPKRLKLDVAKFTTKGAKRNPPTTMNGRQICRLINEFFETEDHMSTVRGCCVLIDLEWLGDDPLKLQEFLDHWGRILNNLEESENISERAKRDLLYRQLCKSKVLDSDVAWYRRRPDAEDHTYAFLRRCVERRIGNAWEEKNLTSRRNASERNNYPLELQPGASAPEAGPKGEAKATANPRPRPKNSRRGIILRLLKGERPEQRLEMVVAIPKYVFFNSAHRGGKECAKGDGCKFSQMLVNDAVVEDVAPPAGSGSSVVRATKVPRRCSAFLSTGKCDC
jgi:hypothetical protein